MKTVLIKTYVMHRMRQVYVAFRSEKPLGVPITQQEWTHEDHEIGETITIHFHLWGWSATYEGTYGRWKGEYDGSSVKNVKPVDFNARQYHDSKHTVTIG